MRITLRHYVASTLLVDSHVRSRFNKYLLRDVLSEHAKRVHVNGIEYDTTSKFIACTVL